jgi:hypothetical protein
MKPETIRSINRIAFGISVLILAAVGLYIIQTEKLYSYSDLFATYDTVFGFVLLILGIWALYLRAEVGIGFCALAVFRDGFIHNYIMSPLIVVLMLMFMIRNKNFIWAAIQTIPAIVQAIMYTSFPNARLFELTEMLGLVVGATYFIHLGIKEKR